MKQIIAQDSVINSVTIKNGNEVVRSDVLAKVFEKQHKHILEKIRNSVSDLEEIGIIGRKIGEYFIEEKVKKQGGESTRYYLTKKGFDLIALSLTGKKALVYKLWYIEAFYEKQKVIEEQKLTKKLNMDDDLWKQFRAEGIEFRNKLTASIRDNIVKYRIEVEGKQNDGRYYKIYTDLIYKVLGINLPKAVDVRDALDKRTLVKLEALEDKVADMIAEYANKGVYYKDAYQEISKKLKANKIA